MEKRLGVGRVFGYRSLNPGKAPEFFGTLPGQDRAIAYGEWEIPQDVAAHRNYDEVGLTLPAGCSKQAHIRMRGSYESESKRGV